MAVGKAIYTPTQWGDGVFYFKEQRDRGEGTMCNKHTAVDRQRTPPEAASSKVPKTQDDGQQTILVKPAQTDLPINIIL